MVVSDKTANANRAIFCACLLLSIGLTVFVPDVGPLSPVNIVLSGNFLFLTAFSLALFTAFVRNLPLTDRIIAGLIMPLAQFSGAILLSLNILLTPKTFDAAAVAFDGHAGWWMRTCLARLLDSNDILNRTCLVVYESLPLILTAAIALELINNDRQRADSRTALEFVLTGCLGFHLYWLMPVVGPLFYSGADWMVNAPSHPGIAPLVPRNCMPSLHTAWTVLAFLSTRGRVWPVRACFALAMLLTILATLGLGLHYLCDLVASIPLVLVVRAACHNMAPSRVRMSGIGMGSLMLAVWVFMFHLNTPIPDCEPMMLVASAAISITWERWAWASSHRSALNGRHVRAIAYATNT